jgi:hypothetical protein
MKHTADVTGGKPIAVLLQSISGVSAINPLVAYDICLCLRHPWRKERGAILLFCPGHPDKLFVFSYIGENKQYTHYLYIYIVTTDYTMSDQHPQITLKELRFALQDESIKANPKY